MSRQVVRIGDPLPLFADAGLERGPDSGLRLGGVALELIARDVSTPVYVYNAATIRARYDALVRAFAGQPVTVGYSVKANGNLAILNILRKCGAGADIVSVGELRRALLAGFEPSDLTFSGVGKTPAELETAVLLHVGCIHLESADELGTLEAIVARRPPSELTAVGIRVNPDVRADTHPYITTGASGIKFGVPIDQAAALADRIRRHPRFELRTIAIHLGSQLLDVEPYVHGLRKLVDLVAELRATGIRTIRTVDIGGGLGIRYRDEEPISPDQLASAVRPLMEGAGFELHLEPGRYFTGSAGVLLTRVLYRKRSGGKQFVILDAGMGDLLRPSHYDAYHEIVPVTARGRQAELVDVVGPLCETGDFLAVDRVLPEVEPGELLAVLGVGAYGFVMSSTYNGRPRPAEVLVDQGRFAVVRTRETVDDLVRGERLAPFSP